MVWNGKKQNKKSISATPPRILKFVCLCFSILAIDALAIDWFDVETEIDWSYTDDRDKPYIFQKQVIITGCSRKSGALMIPPKVDGRTVDGVGNGLFLGCDKLTSVTIPSGVSYIGERSFAGCSGLTSLSIPSSVKTIGRGAFANCKGLTSIEILTKNGKVLIGDSSVFYGCDNVTYATVPGTQCGIDFSSVVNLVIAEGTENIGLPSGFHDCPNLTSVTIPKSVRSIKDDAFSGCSRLTAFIVDPANPYYRSVNGLLIRSVNQLEGNGKTVLAGVNGEVTIPFGVEAIGAYSFKGRTGLTSVNIPSSVKSIRYWAFCGCSGLTSLTIPSSVTSIEDGAFLGCRGLTSVSIPLGVTNLGDRVFEGCSGLKDFIVDQRNPAYRSVNGLLCSKDGTTVLRGVNGEVTIPSSVKVIGKKSFQNCSGLISVEIPSSVKIIEDEAFSDCTSLSSVTIPSSVVRIGKKAFHGCGKLTSFSVGANNVKYCSVNNLLCIKDGATVICGVGGDVTIPEGVVNIGDDAFANISGLTSVKIPSTVKRIGRDAFRNCSNLHSVNMSKGVDSIGYGAFYDCGALTSVKIPSSVTRIEDYAFARCRGLNSVVISSTMTRIGRKAFEDCGNRVRMLNSNEVTSRWETPVRSSSLENSQAENSPSDDVKESKVGRSGTWTKRFGFTTGIVCLIFVACYIFVHKFRRTSSGRYGKLAERRRSAVKQPRE